MHIFHIKPLINYFNMTPLKYQITSISNQNQNKILSWSWMIPIVLRNIFSTWIICGFWDWILYFSPLKEALKPFKMNPKYPTTDQIFHDAFWTTSATITGSAVEILCCYAYCNNFFPPFEEDLTKHLFGNTAWVLLITHWRVIHFYAIHRLMHPWKTDKVPDIGKYLYRFVHSLHHKSYNPTAFSGTSMHPVESTLYYSAALMAVPFGCHPAIVFACIVDCGVGAWLGHDGFQFPGTGDYFHFLHHSHFDCNYGTTIVPLDKWFGTFIGKKEDLKRVWKGKVTSTGMQANTTSVHLPKEDKKIPITVNLTDNRNNDLTFVQ